jgi:phosphatidylglycerophosphatase A
VPLHLLLALTPAPVHVVALLALSVAGIWAAQRYALACGEGDPQRVVIDEVAGTAIALGCVRAAPFAVQLAALVLFRVLDIWKPWPIRRLEHLEPPGVGIMMDDLLAGVFAGALAYGAWYLSGMGV